MSNRKAILVGPKVWFSAYSTPENAIKSQQRNKAAFFIRAICGAALIVFLFQAIARPLYSDLDRKDIFEFLGFEFATDLSVSLLRYDDRYSGMGSMRNAFGVRGLQEIEARDALWSESARSTNDGVAAIYAFQFSSENGNKKTVTTSSDANDSAYAVDHVDDPMLTPTSKVGWIVEQYDRPYVHKELKPRYELYSTLDDDLTYKEASKAIGFECKPFSSVVHGTASEVNKHFNPVRLSCKSKRPEMLCYGGDVQAVPEELWKFLFDYKGELERAIGKDC